MLKTSNTISWCEAESLRDSYCRETRTTDSDSCTCLHSSAEIGSLVSFIDKP